MKRMGDPLCWGAPLAPTPPDEAARRGSTSPGELVRRESERKQALPPDDGGGANRPSRQWTPVRRRPGAGCDPQRMVSTPRLAHDIKGRILMPDDQGYDEARSVFLGAIDRRPATIVRVADTDDVARVIALARETG